MRKRVVVVVLAVLATVAPGIPGTPAGAAPADEGRYAVGVRTETFVDDSRPTSANRTYPGAPDRTLVTTVWYPAKGTPGPAEQPGAPAADGHRYPLLVFAHGYTANGPAYGLLLRRIASAGFVVAAPTFPLSNGSAPGGPRLGDYVNQPADVSFVIDEMLRLDKERSSPYAGLVRRQRIAAAGHSLGGITTIGLLNDCCIDRRIDAYIPMSGIELGFPGGAFSYDRKAPLLLVHGEDDATVPYAGSLDVFDEARTPKFLLTLIDGSHVPFAPVQAEAIVSSMVHFLDRYLNGRDGSIRLLLEDGNVPGVAELVQGR
jgi:alpha-beta hydrolase superfamily lysophospholipase